MKHYVLAGLLCAASAASTQALASGVCPKGMLPVEVHKNALIVLQQSTSNHPTDFVDVCYNDKPDTIFNGCQVGTHCYLNGEKVVLQYPDVPNLFSTGNFMAQVSYVVNGEGLDIQVTAPDAAAIVSCRNNDGSACVDADATPSE